jgi:hypothetical protein
MKHFLFLLIFVVLLPWSPRSLAAGPYAHNFSELQIKDYDQMLNAVEKKVADSKAVAIKMQEEDMVEEGDKQAVARLREALLLILSRPNKDNMVAKLVPVVKKELINYDAFQDVLAAIAGQATGAIQSETLSVSQRATAIYVLENLLSEIKPLLTGDAKLRALVKKIRDADITVPDKVKSHRKLTGMDETPDISKIAGRLYEEAEKNKKPEKKPTPQTETDEDEI